MTGRGGAECEAATELLLDEGLTLHESRGSETILGFLYIDFYRLFGIGSGPWSEQYIWDL